MVRDEESLHAFPLADHWVVLRPDADKLGLLNATAWDVLESARCGNSVDEISRAWTQRYGLSAREAASAAGNALANLHEIGLLGSVANAPSRACPERPPAVAACAANAPPPLALRIGLHPFTLRFADTDLRDRLAGVVRHLRANVPDSAPRLEVLRHESDYVLTRDGSELFRSGELDRLAIELLYHSNEIAQDDERQLLVMHAGAVARDGRAIAIAGISGRGKSTLTAYLACQGYDYLADDMLPIDEASLLAEPTPGCIGLKAPAWPVVATFRPDLSELPIWDGPQKQVRLLPPPRPSRPEAWQSRHELAAILFVEYAEGASTSLVRITAPRALQALIDSQAYFARPLRPARIEKLVRWLERLPAYILSYGSLGEIPERVGALLRN